MTYKVRICTQFFSDSDIKSKDIFHQRTLLTANSFLYDRIGAGRPIYIPNYILKDTKLPVKVPLYLGHGNKMLVLGNVTHINYDSLSKSIKGDLEINERWNSLVLDKYAEGVNGLSVEFRSLEERKKLYDSVLDLQLQCVCIVDRPADHNSRI